MGSPMEEAELSIRNWEWFMVPPAARSICRVFLERD